MEKIKQKLINYFSKISKLSEKEEQYLLEGMLIKEFKKGDIIVEEGKRNKDTFFILTGLVREFKLVDGEEKTTNFYSEEQWIVSLSGMDDSVIASNSLICIEDTWIVVGDETKAIELFQKFPRFESISRKIVEQAFIKQQQLMATYITDKPEQRYQNLLKDRPEIIQRVPQYDIASFIGVKPESLSRLKKKLL